MKLSNSNINQLFDFTRQHYVYHYDVQSELVDHLANDIEHIWTECPDLTFEQARDRSFKKFGVFGFMEVVEAKQKQMNKRYWKFIWRYFTEWFTIPKIVITLSIFLSILFLLKLNFFGYEVIGIMLIMAIIDIVKQFKTRREHQKKIKNNDKVFLLEDILGQARNAYTAMFFANLFNAVNLLRIETSTLDYKWLLFISFLVTSIILLFYIIYYLIPQKAEELLLETYPEYAIAKKI